jgi:outer membrane protein assembly factor BamB
MPRSHPRRPAHVGGSLAVLTALVGSSWLGACQSTWNHFHGDLRNSGFYAVHSPRELVQKWSYPVGDTGFGSPVIAADGTIHVGNRRAQVFAIHPDGSLKWQWDGTLEGQEMITNSPAVASDGAVYVVCQDHVKDDNVPFQRVQSTLFRLDEDDGHVTWGLPLVDLGFCRSSPKVWRSGSNAQVFLQFHSLRGEHLLLVVNARGTLIHRQPLHCLPAIGNADDDPPADPFAVGPFGGYDGLFVDAPPMDPYRVDFLMDWPPDPTPAVVDSDLLEAQDLPILVVANPCSVQALQWDPINRQMTQLWEDLQPTHRYTSPAVTEDGNIFVARDDDHLVGYDRYGNRLWPADFVGSNDFHASPALFLLGQAAFQVYVPTRSRLYKVNASNGALLQDIPVNYPTACSPAITWDRVYLGSEDGMMSMDFSLGDLRKDATIDVDLSSPAIAADGTVYVVSTAGDLVAYRNPQEL